MSWMALRLGRWQAQAIVGLNITSVVQTANTQPGMQSDRDDSTLDIRSMPEPCKSCSPIGDLQCYFFEPSAIAALSATSATGYTVSGTWRAAV